ncbi:hypothetical protein AHAS_Ahas20G0278600 [Arachis hypogaea]
MTLTPIITAYHVSDRDHRGPIAINTNNEHDAGEEEAKQNDVEIDKVAKVEEAVQKPWSLRPRKQTAPAITGGTSSSGNGEVAERDDGGDGKAKSSEGQTVLVEEEEVLDCTFKGRNRGVVMGRNV